MKKSEAIETAIISVIENDVLDADVLIETLAVLFEERSSALWSEKREVENATAS